MRSHPKPMTDTTNAEQRRTSGKRYTTERQRAILASAGVPHTKGRTYGEAQGWINHQIQAGKLPRNLLSPPTEKQLSFLRRHDVAVPSDMTKEEASEKIAALDRVTPLSDRQFKYIMDLGGIPSRSMTRHEASQFIGYLHDNAAACSKCGANNNRTSDRCSVCGGFLPRLGPLRSPRHIHRPKGMIERILSFISGNPEEIP